MSPAEKVISLVRLMATLPTSVADRIVDAWERSLKAEVTDMYAKLLSRIPDMARFQERISVPSNAAYQDYVNPAFVSHGGEDAESIRVSQLANLKMSYQKYADKLAYLFETVEGVPAKRFLERVEMMKNAYRRGVVERLLPFTGTKIEGRGCAPLAGMWLVDSRTVQGELRAGDEMKGAPIMVCLPQDVPNLKSTLVGRLIQAGATIVKSEFDRHIMQLQNDRTNRLVQGLVNPALGLAEFTTNGASHVDYIMVNEQLFLEIKVSKE